VHDKAIFILGGSHGIDLYNAVAMNASNPFIVSVSQSACRAHKFIGNQAHQPRCPFDDFKVFAAEHANNISYVLYTQTPDRLFKVLPFHKSTSDDLSINSINEVVDYLREIKENYSLNVLMIGMLPPLKKSPINWDYEHAYNEQFESILSSNSIYLTKLVDEIFASKLRAHKIPYISKFDGFELDLNTDLIIEGAITYSDRRHLSFSGEKAFGHRLINNLKKSGYSQFNNIN
jgi:hypothetical protein